MRSRAISQLNSLKIVDDATRKSYYGCTQEWYATEWQRLTGCGPTAVCNIIWYLHHIRPASCLYQNCSSKEKSMSFMEEIWAYVTPSTEGIPTTRMLYESVMAYANTKGLDVNYSVCDVPEKKASRPPLTDVISFLEKALLKDTPLTFLNLCNGGEENLVPWHWVTVVSLEYGEDGKSAFIEILDEGLIRKFARPAELCFMILPRGPRPVYVFPKYTKHNPRAMSINPNLRKEPSGILMIFCTQNFIFSGKAKYGSPSTIITIPKTHKKYFIVPQPNPCSDHLLKLIYIIR